MIKILNYEPVEKGAMIGLFDIEFDIDILHTNPPLISTMIIRRVAHLKKNGREWFSFPCFSMEGQEKKTFSSYVKLIRKEDNELFLKEIGKELHMFFDKNEPSVQQNGSIYKTIR